MQKSTNFFFKQKNSCTDHLTIGTRQKIGNQKSIWGAEQMCPTCADMGSKIPIGVSGNYYKLNKLSKYSCYLNKILFN